MELMDSGFHDHLRFRRCPDELDVERVFVRVVAGDLQGGAAGALHGGLEGE